MRIGKRRKKMKLDVKIKKLRDGANIPKYATESSAACDLTACIDECVTVPARGRVGIPTGIAIAPERNDIVGLIFSRSGMGAKKGITLANSVGVIDADYRGELIVALVNHSDEPYTVSPGDRIAQLMFVPTLTAAFTEVQTLDETDRGAGGFGSTGK